MNVSFTFLLSTDVTRQSGSTLEFNWKQILYQRPQNISCSLPNECKHIFLPSHFMEKVTRLVLTPH